MTNRAKRRRKPQRVNLPMSQQKLVAGMYKNGITEKDLQAEFYKGVEAGRKSTIKIVYAAAILAAKSEFKFGKDRAWRLIKALDYHVLNTLSSEEIIDRVMTEMGISLNFADPFETVEKTQ